MVKRRTVNVFNCLAALILSRPFGQFALWGETGRESPPSQKATGMRGDPSLSLRGKWKMEPTVGIKPTT
jgi:hypothetical protein